MIGSKIILYFTLCAFVLSDSVQGFYYIGCALGFLLISVHMLLEDKFSLIKFVLFWLSFCNLVKELFFDPTKFELWQFTILLTPIFVRLLINKKEF